MNVSGAKLVRDAAVGPQLYRILRERIIRGDLAPGSRISEAEIAVGYGVSRQPVREAFIKLAEEALVEIRPQRGTYVRRISIPAVLTARFVREAVEADIVRIVAQRASPETLSMLDAMIVAQRAEARTSDPGLFMVHDEAFHRQLAEAAGHAEASEVLETLKTPMNRVRHLSTRGLSRDRLVDQHAGIVAAIRAGDAEAAAAAMRRHLNEIILDLPAIAAAMPEFFEGAAA